MPSRETQRALLEQLCRGGLLENARVLADAELGASWASRRAIVAAAEGDVTCAGGVVRLRVGLCRRFPAVLPRIFVHPPDGLGRIPHVERDGYVCYLADEGVIIDRDDLASALDRCIELATGVLDAANSATARTDLLREFEAYWRDLPRAVGVDSYVTPDDHARRLVAYCHADRKYAFVADDERAVRAYQSGRQLPALTKRNALYVPLERTVIDDPPSPDALITRDQLRDYVQRHASSATKLALPALTAKWKTEELVVLRLPRPDAGHVLVGVLIRGIQNGHPLGSGTTAVPLVPIAFDRRDRAAVMPRSGAAVDLGDRHILVVGCGSVGGHAAVGLAYAGVGSLTLVDPDTLEPENAFRHAAGVAGDGEPKVDALRAEIERRIPYVDVQAKRGHIELLIESKALSLSDFDGVVVAIGAPTLELMLNEMLWCTAPTNAVFTWLEPEGLGGHALLARSRQPNVRGCVSCLYEPAEAGGPLRNRADFAAPGQFFVRDHVGCGGRFTMFSALDARRTADLATELVLDAVAGRVEGHPLRSWKGDARRFKLAGYALSPRYELSSERLNELACSYARNACKICANT